MRKLVVLVLVAAGLAVAGAQGFLWFKVKRSADRLAEQLAPFAELRYEGIHTSLTGEAGLKKLTLKPQGMDDEIYAEAVIFQAPDLRFLLSAANALESGQLPQRLGLVVKGARVSTVGPLADLLTAAAAAQPRGPVGPLEGCGGRAIGPRELAQMGYTRLESDLSLSYQKEGERSLYLQLSGTTREMAAVDLGLTLSADGLGAVRQLAGAQPRLGRLRVRYSDLGYNRRVAQFCAEALDITPAAFVQQQGAAAQALLAEAGLSAGDAEALQGFFADGGELQLVVAPDQPLNPLELQFYKPSQLIQLLQPRLSLNGQPLELAALGPGAVKRPRPGPAAQPAAAPAVAAAAPQRVVYRPVALTELTAHVGWPVRFRLASGQELEGTLEQAAEASAVIRRRFRSGTMSQPVAYAEIRSAEVLRP